jgi:hypothetical protein
MPPESQRKPEALAENRRRYLASTETKNIGSIRDREKHPCPVTIQVPEASKFIEN